MIRISVTDLESYRYWKADEDSTLEDLLIRLRHEEPPTPAMRAGRAFARLFEEAGPGLLSVVDVDGWRFDFSRMEGEIALPAVREIKAEMRVDTPAGQVTLVGQTDGLDGTVVHDQKLTERWDAEKYIDSLQWRAYLVMFGATAFVYDVFQARYQERHVTVLDYHPMTFYAYPTIRVDVERAVSELAGVIAKHLPERR